MIGTIQQVNKSQSGKTVGAQVDGKWYSTKHWDWLTDSTILNRRIIFEPSQTEFRGQIIWWINDYQFEDVSNTPSSQAMDQALAAGPTPPVEAYQDAPHPLDVPAQAPTVDLSGSIVAQALTKACTGPGEPVTDVWIKYTTLYQSYMNWKP